MLFTDQHLLVNRLVSVTFFLMKIFGLWPYKVKLSARQIEYNFLSIIYSIFVPIIILIAYVLVTFHLFFEDLRNTRLSNSAFRSSALQLVIQCYSHLVIISYLILYFTQHLQRKKKEIAYIKCLKIIDCMKDYRSETIRDDIRQSVYKFLVKTSVYDILNFSFYLYNVTSVSDTLQSKPYLSIFIYLPIFVVRFNTNVFYGGIVVFNVLFKQLNQHLNGKWTGRSEFEKNLRLYFELVTAIRTFTSIFSFQITLWITIQLLLMTSQYLHQCVTIIQLTANNESYLVVENITILTAIVMSSYEVLSTTSACNSLVRKVSVWVLVKFSDGNSFTLQAERTALNVHKLKSKFENVRSSVFHFSYNALTLLPC